jgi:hypothetical protein
MPDFGSFRGFGEKLTQGQTPTQLGLIGGSNFGFDADTNAFISRVTNAGGSLTGIEQIALDVLVKKLKTDLIWDTQKAIYPMVGASAAACAQNLKSASFTGVFNGGWTFASTGVTPDGTTGYMDTNLSPNSIMNFNSQSYFIYKTTVQSVTVCEFGVSGDSFVGVAAFLFDGYNTLNEQVTENPFNSTTTAGAYILNRNNSNIKKLFRNGTLFQTKTSAAQNVTLLNLYLAARNTSGVAQYFSNTQTRFFSVGDGLTDTQASDFYTAVQAFQTTLGRQV